MIQPSCRLYLITPPHIADLDRIATLLPDVLEAGAVAALQIRFKPTRPADLIQAVERLRPIAQDRGVAVILNDDPELAARSGCDGVHIGQGDMPLAAARRIMGPRAMIGVTCHDSRHLAMEAAEAGADYVAFGAFFPTDTKATTHRPEPDILTIWQETMEVPCVAIGGIDAGNAAALARAGADFVAVSSGVWTASMGPVAAAAQIAASLRQA